MATAPTINVKLEGGPGANLIAAERARQVDGEGFTATHDDQWTNDELIEAAAVYLTLCHHEGDEYNLADAWPWDKSWFKPGTDLHNLTRAGALIAAELDRRIRAQSQYETDKRVFTNGTDTFIARSLEEIRPLHDEPECFDDEIEAGSWAVVEPWKEIRVMWDPDQDPVPDGFRTEPLESAPFPEWTIRLIATAAAWAAAKKPGLLCSTEW